MPRGVALSFKVAQVGFLLDVWKKSSFITEFVKEMSAVFIYIT
jgi:hypothetical protein